MSPAAFRFNPVECPFFVRVTSRNHAFFGLLSINRPHNDPESRFPFPKGRGDAYDSPGLLNVSSPTNPPNVAVGCRPPRGTLAWLHD